jgi:hypothetical protein
MPLGVVLAAEATSGKAFRAAERFTFETNPGSPRYVREATGADYARADPLVFINLVFSER